MLKISRVQQKPLKTRLHCFLVDAATALLPSYVSMGNKVLDAWLHQQFVVPPSFLLGKQKGGKNKEFNFISFSFQSSKRTLRSNEIELPNNGLLDTELELTFSLQVRGLSQYYFWTLSLRGYSQHESVFSVSNLATGRASLLSVFPVPEIDENTNFSFIFSTLTF